MLNPKLIDWIRSEEAKKIPDIKLKTLLIKEGWPEKDVDHAINLAHKGKVNWMPLLILFISSLILFFIVNSIDKIHSMILVFLFGSAVAISYTGLVYYNSNKKESFVELLIVNYSSLLFALSLAILFFNLLVLLIYLAGITTTIPLLIIIPSLSIILLFYAFFFIIATISKQFVGYFDHNSYFVFKHWPLKVCNVNWDKKWTLLKFPLSIIVISLVIFGIILNLYFVQFNGPGGFGSYILTEEISNKSTFSEEQLQLKIVQEVDQQRSILSLELKKPTIKIHLFNALDLMVKNYLITIKYYHQLSLLEVEKKVIDYFSTSKISLKDARKTLFIDNFETGINEWRSNDKNYNPTGFWHLETDDNGDSALEGFGHIWIHTGHENWKVRTFETKVKILDGGVHINFIHHDYPKDGRYFVLIEKGYLGLYQQYEDWTVFEKIDGTKIDIKKNIWYDLRVELNDSSTYPIIIYVDNKAIINSTHKPIYNTGSISFETLENSTVWFDDVKVFSYDDKINSYLQNQYNVFEESEDNLTKHIFKLKNSIELLYPKYLKSKSLTNAWGCEESYSYWNIISFSGSMDYLFEDLFYFKMFCDSSRELEEYKKRDFETFYQTKDVKESLQSKVIRLKMIETFLARSVISDCSNYLAEGWEDYETYRNECYKETVELTGSPDLFLDDKEWEYVS